MGIDPTVGSCITLGQATGEYILKVTKENEAFEAELHEKQALLEARKRDIGLLIAGLVADAGHDPNGKHIQIDEQDGRVRLIVIDQKAVKEIQRA